MDLLSTTIHQSSQVRSGSRSGPASVAQDGFSAKPNQRFAAADVQRLSSPAAATGDVVNWMTEAAARRLEVRRTLLSQRAPTETLDDLEQEVIEALLRLGVRAREAHPRTVIWAACRNILARYWQREKARLSVGPEVAESLMASFAGPEDRLNRGDAWFLSSQALLRLAPTPRGVVCLRDIEELSYREIAARLEITEEAARVAHHRGMTKLLADRGERDGSNHQSVSRA